MDGWMDGRVDWTDRQTDTGVSIPWGNEAEIFIMVILGGEISILEEENFCN